MNIVQNCMKGMGSIMSGGMGGGRAGVVLAILLVLLLVWVLGLTALGALASGPSEGPGSGRAVPSTH